MGMTASTLSDPPVYPHFFVPVKLCKPQNVAAQDSEPPVDHDAPTPVAHVIDFSKSPLAASYSGLFAMVIDNCLTPKDCADLIALAELGRNGKGKGEDEWVPAQIDGFVDLSYRNSGRIIRDDKEAAAFLRKRLEIWLQEVRADRLGFPEELDEEEKENEGEVQGDGSGRKRFSWEFIVHDPPRLLLVPDESNKQEHQGEAEEQSKRLPPKMIEDPLHKKKVWEFSSINERLRFLKYTKGQDFKPHCDAHYSTALRGPSLPFERSWVTVQTYLSSNDLVGGATTFHGRKPEDKHRTIDVEPRPGRILLFQQSKLMHSGQQVRRGTKVTVRTDVMYRIVDDAELELRKSMTKKEVSQDSTAGPGANTDARVAIESHSLQESGGDVKTPQE
ncbi:hypothetical protein BDZ91DRAFT_83395 [Kalaharituber pfeilii]|nr:hypothetical protein BDZ91DRAFT_83395 [Kalaharituber pfeilii]